MLSIMHKPRWAVSLVCCVFFYGLFTIRSDSRGLRCNYFTRALSIFKDTPKWSEWVSERERAKQQEESSLYRNNFFFFRLRSVWTQAWWWCYSCVLSLLILFYFLPSQLSDDSLLYNSFANITFFSFLYWFDSMLHGGFSGVSHWLHCLLLIIAHTRADTLTHAHEYELIINSLLFWFCSHTREFQWILTYLSCRRWSTSSLRAQFESQFH